MIKPTFMKKLDLLVLKTAKFWIKATGISECFTIGSNINFNPSNDTKLGLFDTYLNEDIKKVGLKHTSRKTPISEYFYGGEK